MNVQVIIPEVVNGPIPLSLRLSSLTDDKKIRFIEILADTGGNTTKAAKAVGVTRQAVYQWREKDLGFALAWDEALEAGTENLEESMYVRACNVDTTAAIFLLKARRPEKYREVYKVEQDQADPTQLAEALFAVMLAAAERLRASQGQLAPAVTPDTGNE